MRILVLGADGFIGRRVSHVLASENDVYRAVRTVRNNNEVKLDLLDRETVKTALASIKPQVLINCAGVVENSERAKMNVKFTKNLLESADKSGLQFNKIIICGSAAEYGEVDKDAIPVDENTPLKPNTEYGRSKMQEEKLAIKYKNEHNLPVVILRIFNPIGSGMHPRMIIPGIVRQAEAIKEGNADTIEVSRLDSKRDYINVEDVAKAIRAVVLGDTTHDIYNVGSGESTSNQQLIDMVLKHFNLSKKPKLAETSSSPEPPMAIQANIKRIVSDLGWRPECTIEDSIKEVFSDAR